MFDNRIIQWGGGFFRGAIKIMGALIFVLGLLKFHGLLFRKDIVEINYLSFANPLFGFLTNKSVIALAACTEMIAGWVALRYSGRVATLSL